MSLRTRRIQRESQATIEARRPRRDSSASRAITRSVAKETVIRERVVVKIGGTTLADQRATLAEVATESRRRDLIVVHGGGKRLTEWLGRLGVETRFQDGLRITGDDAME